MAPRNGGEPMRNWLSRVRAFRAGLFTAAAVAVSVWTPAVQASVCGDGLWADAMIASYHVHPDKDFKQFNPGIGVECWIAPQWALTGGYFRNSLSKPSFYGGGVWGPDFLHWRHMRLAVMAGLISGYDYGSYGLGHNHTVGPVAAPLIMLDYKRVGANIILIPPIPSSDLPFTLGFMLRLKF